MGKRGAIAKYDYDGEDFLTMIETLAKKGCTDREICYAIGLNPTYLSDLKLEHPKIIEVLTRGRAAITAAVRQKFLTMALGGLKTKNKTVRKLRGSDGTLTGEEEVQETEIELPPSLQAMSVWLYHYDDDWKKTERKQDEDSEDVPQNIGHGVNIDSWIKDKIKE